MQNNQIARLLARDLLMCIYDIVAKDELPEIVNSYRMCVSFRVQPGRRRSTGRTMGRNVRRRRRREARRLGLL